MIARRLANVWNVTPIISWIMKSKHLSEQFTNVMASHIAFPTLIIIGRQMMASNTLSLFNFDFFF